LKYRELHHQAKHIDRLVDAYIHAGGSLFITQENLKKIVLKYCPDFYVEGRGKHKIVFGNRAIDHKVVLKMGPKKSIENDHRAYKRVPEKERHRFFARIYWHTKYCLLQEYGFPAQVTSEQLAELRQAVYKYGIIDVKADNLRTVNGELKIIDANATRIPLPTLLQKIDEAKQKMPKKLKLFVERIVEPLH
jgi:hypothetical protein